jgi:glycosyltransferase involved in cell wall biosynthesis
MVPPLISYVVFHRLGLTVQSLPGILSGNEDFELHIIDSNSSDGTWDYLMSIDDPRIKSVERFEINHGKTFAVNTILSKRKPEQYFFHIDNDVHIETKDWIKRFMAVFEGFPEAGLLGVKPEEGYLPPVVPKKMGAITYLELCDNLSDVERNYVPGCCFGMKPELIQKIGYLCEENYAGDRDLSYRVCNHTEYKAGLLTDVRIRSLQSVDCVQCAYFSRCKLDKVQNTCFTKYQALDKNDDFREKNNWRFAETRRDMEHGARPVYCASLSDAKSLEGHIYNQDWAMDNFLFYIRNAN